MNNKRHTKPYNAIFLFLILSFLASAACRHINTGGLGVESPAVDIKRIAIIGFKPSVYQGGESYETTSETSLLEKSYYMTSMLFEAFRGHEGYELVSPESVRETGARIDASEPGLGNDEIAVRIARELQADAALMGYLYRWKDREGSDYAIRNPASVFFDLRMVGAEKGSILWEGRFNKTQRSLNENLLDIKTFLKGKGKWMTAEALAEVGLKDLADDLFLFIEKGAGN